MTGVQGAAAQTVQSLGITAKAQFIDPCFQTWVRRHTERLAYQRLINDPEGVIEVPGSRRMGQNGMNIEYVSVRPASDPSAKPLTMPSKFLVTRERRDELLRERAAWEHSHPR